MILTSLLYNSSLSLPLITLSLIFAIGESEQAWHSPMHPSLINIAISIIT